MMRTQFNSELVKAARDSLAETKSFGWDEEDRMLSACGAVLKKLYSSDFVIDHAASVAKAIVTQIMEEEKING